LEVKNAQGEQFRILVKNFEEWKALIEESQK
jgi:hypothetical protein